MNGCRNFGNDETEENNYLYKRGNLEASRQRMCKLKKKEWRVKLN